MCGTLVAGVRVVEQGGEADFLDLSTLTKPLLTSSR